MKFEKLSTLKGGVLLLACLFFVGLTSCGEDDDPEPQAGDPPIASFQFEIDATEFSQVTFSNFSQNATAYVWDFGDGNSSAEENPVHTYASAGSYEVTLTASADGVESADQTRTVEIIDPLAAQRTLIGDESKTWKIIRDVSTGALPFVVGPTSKAEVWWSFGGAQPICERPCILDDTYTFNSNGKMDRNVGDDFWAEGGIWAAELEGTCFDTNVAANWTGNDGADLSAWGTGSFDYTFDTDANTLTLTGEGAYMGLSKAGTDKEFTSPQDEVTYKVVKLVDADVDTLVLETILTDDAGAEFGYWALTFVSYDNESSEPAIPACEDPGEDIPNETPTALFNTFASTEAADVDGLVPTESTVTLTPGVDDPTDASAAKVGEYVRGTEMFADLKFQLEYNAQFDNFNTVSIDVYFPSTNDYSGALSQQVDIFIADASTTAEFWTNWVLLSDATATATDEWVTFSFDLTDAKARADLDLIGLKIGGENHDVNGTFYVRNLRFQ